MLEMNDHSCHVLWEDRFVSWEKKELLTVDVELTKRQTIRVSSDVNQPVVRVVFYGGEETAERSIRRCRRSGVCGKLVGRHTCTGGTD